VISREIIVLVLFVAAAPAAHALSISDILKGSADSALRFYASQVMPVDGWAKVEKGEALVVRGQALWNPDYYVVFKQGKVKFTGPIPTGVDVRVEVYKVYFGLIAFYEGEYQDVWWSRGRIGDGWAGSFFVSGFKWRWWGGESDVKRAYIAYNSPSVASMQLNETLLQINDTVRTVDGVDIDIINWEIMHKVRLLSDIYILI